MASTKKTTIIAGSGYNNIKTTEKYTPDTAPINYQEPDIKEQKPTVAHIVLEPDKPRKELNITNSFLESFSRVYITGQYPVKGHTNLKIKSIISLIVLNSGLYHVVVPPSLKQSLLDIIEFGDSELLGMEISDFVRSRILTIYKHDNALT
jgi:hypothetical protein